MGESLEKTTYRLAGVDIDRANLFVEKIKPLVKLTARKEVMGTIGGFGGLFHLDLKKTPAPVLVASTDGVGTKLMIARMMNRHDTVGIDLVAMNVNDVVVQGAEPLFFLDYIATGRIGLETSIQLIEGIVKGCQEAGCALLGGELAEMPGFYDDEEYDLAGFCVGVVDYHRLVDGSEIRVGDRIVGLASSGLHSNGFSLARKVFFEIGGFTVSDYMEDLGTTLGEALLTPTRIYVRSMLNILKNFNVKGIVHITGGGFLDNIPRIVPEPCQALIEKGSWPVPPIFDLIRRLGPVDEGEMMRVFNMGVGMMAVVPKEEAQEVVARLEKMGERAFCIGSIVKRETGEPVVKFV